MIGSLDRDMILEDRADKASSKEDPTYMSLPNKDSHIDDTLIKDFGLGMTQL